MCLIGTVPTTKDECVTNAQRIKDTRYIVIRTHGSSPGSRSRIPHEHKVQ